MFLVFAAFFVPLDARDNSPTIWAEGTIAVMKEQRAKLFNITLDLYNKQDYFDNPVNCVVPPPAPQYLNGTQRCANANLVSHTYKS